MHVSFLDLATLAPADLNLAPLKALATTWQPHPATSAEQTLAHLSQAEVAITNKVVLNADVIRQSPNLKLILVAATGTNNVDLDACLAHRVQVRNCQRYGVDSIAQHALALMLALANRIPANHQAAITLWPQASSFCLLHHQPMELTGKTLGVIGYGAVGQRVAQFAQALGMNIMIAERKAEQIREGRHAFEQVLKQADVLTLHCPLSAETQGLIANQELAAMKPHALLINTARGGVVDELALIEALEAKQIAGAAFDVLTQEPPAQHHPLLQSTHPNLILSPHMAWGSQVARQTIIEQMAENIVDYQQGGSLRRIV